MKLLVVLVIAVACASADVSRVVRRSTYEVPLQIEGSNQYISPDGQKVQFTFTADENGYQPQGEYLPTIPPPQPIPEYILRSLAYNAAHPQKEK